MYREIRLLLFEQIIIDLKLNISPFEWFVFQTINTTLIFKINNDFIL